MIVWARKAERTKNEFDKRFVVLSLAQTNFFVINKLFS